MGRPINRILTSQISQGSARPYPSPQSSPRPPGTVGLEMIRTLDVNGYMG